MKQMETLAQMVARLDEEAKAFAPVFTFSATLDASQIYDTVSKAIYTWASDTKKYIGDISWSVDSKRKVVHLTIGVADSGDIYREKHKYM